MVTLGKNRSIHARRRALAVLRQKGIVKKLFDDIAQRSAERNGGYSRIVKLGGRKSESVRMAFIERVDAEYVAEKTPKKEKKAKRKDAEAEPQQITPEAEQPTQEEPKAEASAPGQEEPLAPPAEEPKPKKRRWFGRKSDDSLN